MWLWVVPCGSRLIVLSVCVHHRADIIIAGRVTRLVCVCEFHDVFFWSLHVLNVVECGFHVLLQHSVPFLLSAELIWNHTKYTRAIAFAFGVFTSAIGFVRVTLFNIDQSFCCLGGNCTKYVLGQGIS